ncbi:hypothetical protein DPMN_032380 [Dreissena polymorpha]|uniref:Uncharacterized protein n=1 Tax=Dreissena polymorpha TaxID=45954 RepID=A0A9D4RIV6_DREPO|nr:hypothetical protein DPMN_032380 [Dreissena polymorpha]
MYYPFSQFAGAHRSTSQFAHRDFSPLQFLGAHRGLLQFAKRYYAAVVKTEGGELGC